MRTQRRRSRGAVAVEFALIVPVLVGLLLGVTTLGLAYSHHLALTNAVRESARLGASIDYSTGAAAWGDAVQARVQQVYFDAGTGVGTSQVCVKLVDSSGAVKASPTTQGSACGTEPTPPTMASGTCAVIVWASRPEHVTLGVWRPIDFSVSARSVSIYGRTAGVCTAS